ncbi:MAG: FAD-dependent oxidoreductase [Nanoarchaeota archaeon]
MQFENWLNTGILHIKSIYCPPLEKDATCDCLVIGGGFAGLHAALRLVDAGKEVILLEKGICGSGSSGRSAGFLTPHSEEDLNTLIEDYGIDEAKTVAGMPAGGVKLIIDAIKKYSLDCDFRAQDSIYLALHKGAISTLKYEMETLKKLGEPFKFYNKSALRAVHPGEGYEAGLRYHGTYGINSLAYTQELKNVLIKKGVKIYEGTEVHGITGNKAITHLGSVKAKNILVCIDKMKTEFDKEVSKKYYHMQTFLSVSEPLSKNELKSIFPSGNLMCWDSDLLYMYYRIIGENRLLLGGASYLTTYYHKHYNSPSAINKVIAKFKKRFSSVSHIDFNYYWNGLIDVTKDLTPIADYDPKNKSIQYTLGCAGLPWAAFCGDYIARRVLDKNTKDLSQYLGMHRTFPISDGLQEILGKIISFGLSHLKLNYG